MNGELEQPGIEGKVLTGGVSQAVTRQGNHVHIRLTRIPGAAVPHTSYGGIMTTPLPEPVTVEAGTILTADIDLGLLTDEQRENASQPMHIPQDMTVTKVYTGPSAVDPGRHQGAIG
jgi:hypothetical protein